MEHLNELRTRIIYCIIYFVLGSVVGFLVTDRFLFQWLLSPILKIPEAHLQVLGPEEKISSFFKTSFIAGAVIALPFMMHQVWLFLKPGLKAHERRYVLTLLPASILLFLAGASFVFFIMIPTALNILIGFDPGGIDIAADITLDRYFSFVLLLILAGGLIFQIPVLTYFLAKLGLVSKQELASQRKIAVVATVFLAAILTPTGDPINLMLLSVPIYVLYELSIIIAGAAYKKQE